MMNGSRRAGLFLAALTVLGCCSVPLTVSSASAEIHGSLLTPAEVSAYEAAITNARNTQSDLDHRTNCLNDQDRQMAVTRDGKEKTLGDLHREIEQLTAENDKLEQQYNEFKTSMNNSQSEYKNYNAQLEDIKSTIDEKRRSYEDCRKYG